MFKQKHCLSKLNQGQSVVEYLVFFAMIAAFTLLSISAFYPKIHQAGESAFQKAVQEMLK